MLEALLATPPGSLASHLAVGIAVTLVFGVAASISGSVRTLRWSAASAQIAGLRLALIVIGSLNWVGAFDSSTILPPLEWYAAVSSALLFGWPLLVPRTQPRWDSAFLGINALLVVALAVTIGAGQIFGARASASLWNGAGSLSSLAIAALLIVRRPTRWRAYFASFTLLSLAFGIDLLVSSVALRAAELIAYPLMAFVSLQNLAQIRQLQAAAPENEEKTGRPSTGPSQRQPRFRAEPVGSITALLQDMQAPIESITGYRQMLNSSATGDLTEDQRKFLDQISSEVSRLKSRLQELLALVAEPRAALVSQVDFAGALDTAANQVAGELQKKDLTLRIEAPSDLPAIGAEPDILRQISVMLLENAIQSSPTESEILVTAAQDQSGPWITLSVSDSGEGFPPEDLGRIFQPQAPTEDGEPGLAQVKALTESLGGRVWISSEVGSGTTVTVVFPISEDVSGGS